MDIWSSGADFLFIFQLIRPGGGKNAPWSENRVGPSSGIAYYYIKCLEIYTNDTLTTFIALNPAQNDIEYTYSVKNAISFYFRYSI